MFANPVAVREFIGILRTRKAFAILVGFAVLFTTLVVMRWPSADLVGMSGEASRQVFRVFGYGMLASLLLLTPAFPATSIVSERHSGTLALLLNSPMSPWSIYLGKAAGILGFVVVLLLTSLPAAAACYAMGGVSLVHQFGWLYVVLILVALQITALALWVSTIVTTADAALRVTYGAVFAIAVLTMAPHFFVQGKPGWPSDLAWLLRCTSPIPVVMDLLGNGELGAQGVIGQGRTNWYVPMTLVSTIVMVLAAVNRLNYRIYDQSRSQGVITDELSSGQQWFRRFSRLIDPQRRAPGIPWYLNAVMVKEFRTRRFGRMHWLLRLVSLCAVISLTLTLATLTGVMDWGVEVIGGIMVVLQVMLVVLVTPSLAAGLISGERESGGWELLKATPLSATSIVFGKLMSVAGTLLLILMATLPGYLVMISIRPVMWLQVQQVLISLGLAALFTMMVSAAISSFFSRTAPATATTYCVLTLIFAGTLLIWLGRDAPFGYDTVRAALLMNPMAVALSIIETPGFADFNLAPLSWWITAGASLFALIVLCVQCWRLTRPV